MTYKALYYPARLDSKQAGMDGKMDSKPEFY